MATVCSLRPQTVDRTGPGRELGHREQSGDSLLMCPRWRFVECLHLRCIPAQFATTSDHDIVRMESNMSTTRSVVPSILVGLIGMAIASSALAQANRAT